MPSTKKLMFVTEARFYRDEFNNFYGDKAFDTQIWERYLSYFDEIQVIARVKLVKEEETEELLKNENIKVTFIALPYFIGLKQLLLQRHKLIKRLNEVLENTKDYGIILRVPGTIGYYAAKYLTQHNIKYHAEIVGDPDEVFAKENFNHPLRPLLRLTAVNQLKYVVKGATSALYVTQNTLQDKYPFSNKNRMFGISSVNIPSELIADESKKHEAKRTYKIISVGSLAQMYKAPDIVLKALKIINESKENFIVELVWLGDGIYKEQMINLSNKLGMQQIVHFRGNVTRQEVLDEMHKADVFVLASRTEGLPRVVIEAMAMGMPVVATNVGGIPELLDTKVLVNKNDSESLAKKIKDILLKPELYNEQAQRNLLEAGKFKKSQLDARRIEFFKGVAKE